MTKHLTLLVHRIFPILLFIGLGFSTTINIPMDYNTIQEGIDNSNNGDTVIVNQGIYFENLILDKEIVLTSNFIFDVIDPEWYENENIQNTIIDGSLADQNSSFGSCLVIRDNNIAPIIIGFTFRGGLGTVMVDIDNCAVPIRKPERSGGGINIFKAYPIINYNRFIDNGIGDQQMISNGGAISHFDDDDVEFDEDRFISSMNDQEQRDVPEQLNIQNNLFENNSSGDGRTFYSRGYDGPIDLSESIFDNIDCEENRVNDFVLKSRNNLGSFIQNDISGNCISGDTIFVSINGDDGNSGTEMAPVKTIGYAFTLVKNDSLHTTTIQIGEGVFSPSSTGEKFPIYIPDNIHLIGTKRETSILDAESDFENQRRVLVIEQCENVKLAKLTITGGNAQDAKCYGGGGIFIAPPNPSYSGAQMIPSTPVLEDIIVTGNHAYAGGGISVWESEGPILSDVIISNNDATWLGGGIMIALSDVTIENSKIFNNYATEGVVLNFNQWPGSGGGIYIDIGNLVLTKTSVYNNHSSRGSGLSIWRQSDLIINQSVFYGNTTGSGGSINSFGLNGMVNISNSIFWLNTPNDVALSNQHANINFTNLDWEGESNIYEDPLFLDAESGDFILQIGSPCIDAGTADPNNDGENEINDFFGFAPDLGVFEFSYRVEGIGYSLDGQNITLSWDSIDNSQYYLLEQSLDSNFVDDVDSFYVYDNNYIASGLEFNVEYFYRVSAFVEYFTDHSETIAIILDFVGIHNNEAAPNNFALNQNHPNPFNPITTLKYDLPKDSFVSITVYDMLGNVVNNLVNANQSSGYKSIQWDATNNTGKPVSAGIYFYTIEAGDFVDTKKMILLK